MPRRPPLTSRLRSAVDAARGFFSGDLRSQLAKASALLTHRAEHAQLNAGLLHFRFTLALLFCQRLGLLERLREGALSPAEAAAACGIHQRAATLLLRVLESQGLAAREGERFGLTSFARTFVTSNGPLSYAPMLELLATYAASFDEVLEGMRSGKVARSMDVYQPDADVDAFLEAVNRYLDNAGRELLAKARLPKVKSFIVGSMGVSFSALVLAKHPGARVTYGCLPHLVERIPRLRTHYGVDPSRVDGMHGHGGEPAADRWGSEDFDLVFLTKKMVLAPDERVGEKFAAKALQVLRPGGATVLWEAIHEDDGPTPMARALESLLDLGVCPTGCVWTRNGIEGLLRGLGYASVETVPCLGGETSFVVARKA
ncbi:MAG: methyltransferase family protein [Myxococcaceae bacterium]